MSSSTFSPVDLLSAWLQQRLPAAGQTWLEEKLDAVRTGDRKTLFLSFGLVPRKLGKADLNLTPTELKSASSSRPGWDPRFWTVDQAARTLLVLKFGVDSAEGLVSVLDQLFAAGEVQELIALYQGLPLYAHQPAHQLRCAEGMRTNIPAVFTAIAHRNPFPSEQLTDDQWNQLILKSLFIGVSLDQIVGIDRRTNAKLAAMLTDFARERRAAGRPVPLELWRCVAPFASDAALGELEQALKSGRPDERTAAALALTQCPQPAARQLLAASHVDLADVTWSKLATVP